MAIAIALGILVSAWLFGRIEPYISDLTGYAQPTAIPAIAQARDSEVTPQSPSNERPASTQTVVPTEANESQPTIVAAATETPDNFVETHQSNPDFTVNFRPGPSIDSGEPVAALDPGTPLQYLDEQTVGDDGSIWLRMKTREGLEGWLREVDTIPVP